MRKIALMAAILIACGSWACQGHIGHPGEAVTVQGCLSSAGSNKYTLTNDAGVAYQLTGSTGDLGPHVGQQVLIRGEQVESSKEPEAPANATSQGVPNLIVVTSATFTSQKCGPSK